MKTIDLRETKKRLRSYKAEDPIQQAWLGCLADRLSDRLSSARFGTSVVPQAVDLAILLLAADVARGRSGLFGPLPSLLCRDEARDRVEGLVELSRQFVSTCLAEESL